MRQLLQRLDTGETYLEEVPAPAAPANGLLVRTAASVVSVGTERMLVDFGKAGMLEKARRQPDKVRQVLDKARSDGILDTVDAVRSKLAAPIPLGYCHAGTIIDVGRGSDGFSPGERVITNGPHAEIVAVADTLAARIPEAVPFEAAAFTPIAAIALQGIRLASPTLGETVVVYGLGLVGLLTIQLLRATGCRVIGIDRDADRLALGARFGADVVDASAEDVVERVRALTAGIGADAVLLTLASDSDEPVHLAAQASRKRGRLVLVGVTGLRLRREDFYEKELTFQVSCSYGPGRYDALYEEKGVDYPLPYVRWTEQRNFEAVLRLMQEGKLDPEPLITHRIPFGDAPGSYSTLGASTPSLGVVFEYPTVDGEAATAPLRAVEVAAPAASTGDRPCVAVLGAGNFAMRTLLPILEQGSARLHTIVSSGGTSAGVAAKRFGFEHAATDVSAALDAAGVDAVFILTRHDTHADLVVKALDAGKHVFVEKPLAVSIEQLEAVREAVHRNPGRVLTVGFNRRFSRHTGKMRAAVRRRSGPLTVLATINAGAIPREHWVHDPEVGGGRILGEGVHWIDLARDLVDAPLEAVRVTTARGAAGRPLDDVGLLSLTFADGSVAAIHYLARGSRRFPKERIECFFDDQTLAIDNWRRFRHHGTTWRPAFPSADKGHAGAVDRFMTAVREGGDWPIPLDQLMEVSRFAIHAGEQARSGGAEGLDGAKAATT